MHGKVIFQIADRIGKLLFIVANKDANVTIFDPFKVVSQSSWLVGFWSYRSIHTNFEFGYFIVYHSRYVKRTFYKAAKLGYRGSS